MIFDIKFLKIYNLRKRFLKFYILYYIIIKLGKIKFLKKL